MSGTIAGFRDRRGLLVFAGVVKVVLGVLCVLLAALTVLGGVLGAKSGNPQAASTGMIVAGALFYAGFATFFLWMGIGSIAARRWARAIMLAVSWLWFAFGAVGMAFWLVTLPHFLDGMASTTPATAPPRLITIMVTVITALNTFVYLILPLFFLVIYRGHDVKLTCEARDPVARWTDRCPLPVLAAGIMLAYGAAGFVGMLAFKAAPFMGRLVTGLPAAAGCLVLAAVSAWLAVAVCRLKVAGWWGTLVLTVVGAFSTALTFTRIDMNDWYRALGMADEQIRAAASVGATATLMLWWTIGGSALFLAYLAYIYRYFRATPARG